MRKTREVAQILNMIRTQEKSWREVANRIGVGNTLESWSWDVCISKAHALCDLADDIEAWLGEDDG